MIDGLEVPVRPTIYSQSRAHRKCLEQQKRSCFFERIRLFGVWIGVANRINMARVHHNCNYSPDLRHREIQFDGYAA